MAWLTGWNRRKQLYLSSTNSTTNYQMRIIVNYSSGTDNYNSTNNTDNIYCGGNCKTDFSDIRFTDSTGSYQLNYWIESYSASSNAIIWIKIPSIPNGTNSTYIYVYYNNTNPPSDGYNNGNNTFQFFDNFSGTTIDTTKWGYVGTISVSSGTVSTTGNTNTNYIYSINKFSQGSAAKLLYKSTGSSGAGYGRLGFIDDYTKYLYDTGGASNAITFQDNAVTLYADLKTPYQSTENNIGGADTTYHLFELLWSSGIDNWIYDGTSKQSYTNSQYIPSVNMYFKIADYSTTDWVFIRKYATPEPTWSPTISTEQSVIFNINSTPSGGEIWLAFPSGSSWADQNIQTNTTLYVAPGTSYDVMVGLGGYQPWTLYNVCSGNCAAGSTWDIIANLILQPGTLAISSTPTGAEIYLALSPNNPVDQGTTTISGGRTISNLSPGLYNIKLILSGYANWTGTATISSNNTTTVNATFAGSAYMESTPTNSSIYLDGNLTSIGNTPLTIANLTPSSSDGTQPTQSHSYRLTLPGYADTSGSFTATAGQTISIPVTFPGSLYISSIPEGAQIYIDGILQ